MPRKSKPTQDSIRLDFTGKASILIELEGYGPMQYRINDKDVVLSIVKLLISEMGTTTPVDSYDGRTAKTFKKILDF